MEPEANNADSLPHMEPQLLNSTSIKSSQKGTKHNTMTHNIRIALCKHHKANPSLKQWELQQWLEKEHNIKVCQSTICSTLKRCVELLEKEENTHLGLKRQRAVMYPEMETMLVSWFKTNQERANLSGDLIKETAAKILDSLYPGHKPFRFSNGWLDSFKARHGIKTFRRNSKNGSVNLEVAMDILPAIRQLLDKFAWRDIYNMVETGLFYRMQADESVAAKQLEGRKQDKERITLAVCCNGDGSDKFPLWVIGKYRNPRCFNNIKMDNVGCKYRSNPKALMTRAVFVEWLKAFDDRMAGRKVVLTLENCNAHIPLAELQDQQKLKHTSIIYLPPNTTSMICPCDAGIIRNFKAYYRRRFNWFLLQRLEENVSSPEKIDVLEAVKIAVAAWNVDVKAETIQSCFSHCRIRNEPDGDAQVSDEDFLDVEVVAEIKIQMDKLHYENPMEIDKFLGHPDEDVVSYVPNVNDIIENFLQDANLAPTDEEDDSEELAHVTVVEARKAIRTLETFWLQVEGDNTQDISLLRGMKDKMCVSMK